MKKLTFPIIFFFINFSFAQNLVRNGNFEEFTNPPTKFCDSKDRKINNFVKNWYSPNTASPDLITKNTLWEEIEERYSPAKYLFGNGAVGLLYKPNKTPIWGEYIQSKLLYPIIKHHYYYAEVMVASSHSVNLDIKNWGISFTKDSLCMTDDGIISSDPQLKANCLEAHRWRRVNGVFEAKENSNYITLGFFNNLIENDTRLPVEIYFLIDNIMVKEINKNDYLYWIPNLEDLCLDKGNNVIIKNLKFADNKYEIDSSMMQILNQLQRFLIDNPTLRIEIQGHTDNTYKESYNQDLSEKRAKAVYDFLIYRNVNPKQLNFKGYGQSKPIFENTTSQNKENNRRVSFEILQFNSLIDNYLLACRYSKDKILDSAFFYLQSAIKMGADELVILCDEDLNNLKQDKRYAKIDQVIKTKYYSTLGSMAYKPHCFELNKIWIEDQIYRQPYQLLKKLKGEGFNYKIYTSKDSTFFLQLNKEHQKTIDRIVTPRGTDKNISKKAKEAVWLVVQHSANVGYMEKYLPLFKDWARIDKQYNYMIPYLIDRMLVLQKKSQRYGTQYIVDPVSKEERLLPLENAQKLNEWRKLYDLEPIN